MVFQRLLSLPSSLRFFLISLLLLLQFNSEVKAQEWELVKSSDGIEVFTRTTEAMDYKAFKSVATIEADIESFVALIQDVEVLHEWGYKLKSSELLERNGDTLQIYFAEAKAPFPYRNRYGIYLNEFVLLVNYEFDVDDLVMLKGSGYWKVIQLENQKLKVVFEMQVDPGKGIPAWLSNMFADESPYETMLSVKTELKKAKYQDRAYDFLKN